MKKRIMVLDDDAQIRQSLLKLLRTEGYEVVLAADGSEAFKEFSQQFIDLLLLDLNLPGENGWEVFARVSSANPLLPVVIITGKNKQSAMAMAAGVGALMEKPLDVSLLLQTIAKLLAEHPEKRLKRLIGTERSTRFFRRVSPALSKLKGPKTRVAQEGSSHPQHGGL